MITLLPGGDEVLGLIPGSTSGYLDASVDGDWNIFSDARTSLFAISVAGGDLDGDGYGDLAIGVPMSDRGNGAGAVLLYFSRDRDELRPMGGFSDADVVIWGVNKDDKFGTLVRIVDLTYDGRDELIVSAPFADGNGNARRDCGEVYIVQGRDRTDLGRTDGIENLSQWGHVIGRDAGDHLGVRMDFGDVNADGAIDLIIGSEGQGGTANSAPEGTGGSPWGENGILGSWEVDVIDGRVPKLGEVDIGKVGSLVRYYGGHMREGFDIPTHIGNGLAVTDHDGDGHDDLMFTYRWDSRGWLAIQKGGPSFPYLERNNSLVFPDPSPGDNGNPHPIFRPNMTIDLGADGYEQSLLCKGDADGSPHKDVLVGMTGAPDWSGVRTGAGQVDLILGGPIMASTADRSMADWTLFGADAGDGLGSAMVMTDRDHDGFDELFIGTHRSDGQDNTREGAGEMFGFYPSGSFMRNNNLSDADLLMQGGKGHASFTAMCVIDMDGNEEPELVISSPGVESPDDPEIKGQISIFGLQTSFDASFYSTTSTSNFGSGVLLEDLDDDGYLDLIVSSPTGNVGYAGYVHVYFGGPVPWSGRYPDSERADLEWEPEGLPRDDSRFGIAIASGDLDDDGYSDVIIGMPQYNSGNPGRAFIYWGGTRSQMAAEPYTIIHGYLNTKFGSAASTGDINGDGFEDMAISAPFANSGPDSARFQAGRVHVWYGPLSRSTLAATSSPLKIEGRAAGDLLAATLHFGDIDGDGRDEIIMGSPTASPGTISRQGAVFIVNGSSSLPSTVDLLTMDCVRIDGEWPYDAFGSAISTADVDGDGRSEFIASSTGADGYARKTSNGGAVYILNGTTLSPMFPSATVRLRVDESDVRLYGSQEGETFGTSVHAADVDGDGLPEVLIGSPRWFDRDQGTVRGAISVIGSPDALFGGSINSSDIPKIQGQDNGALFGYSMASGRIDTDPKYDLVIGAPQFDPERDGSSQGGAFLWLSKPLTAREVKVRTAQLINPDMVFLPGDGTPSEYLSPRKGPYIFRVEAYSVHGIGSMEQVVLTFRTEGARDMLVLRFHTGNGTFVDEWKGKFKGTYSFDTAACRASTDGSVRWLVDFALVPDWNWPDAEMVITTVLTSMGDDSNHRSFVVPIDRTVAALREQVVITSSGGGPAPEWISNSTLLDISNITLVHGITGRAISGEVAQGLVLGLLRSDGLRIGSSVGSGGNFGFGEVSIGEYLSGRARPFYVIVDSMPSGMVWEGLTLELNVDTYAPAMIDTFTLYADGRQDGYYPLDDDPIVELDWIEIKDSGDSGIKEYLVHIHTGGVHEVLRGISPRTLLALPDGLARIGLQAVDNAGNEGGITYRDVRIDLKEPAFFGLTPADGTWLRDGLLRVTVEAVDNGSGLDLESARVRYFLSATQTLSSWIYPTGILNESGRIILVFDMPKVEGVANYIQWSIKDLSGRETISRAFNYNIDLGLPQIDAGDPSRTNWIGPGNVTVSCEMIDAMSGLDLSTASYRFGPREGFYDLGWTSLGYAGTGAVIYPDLVLDPDFTGYGYLQWRVSDKAGNSAESEIIVCFVDRTPPRVVSVLPNGTVSNRDRDVTVIANIAEMESAIPTNGVEYSVSRMSDWIDYGIGGYSPWKRVQQLIDLGLGSYQAQVNLTFDEGDFNFVKFRLMDVAGNGWVESSPYRIRVSLPKVDLPPVALFLVTPYVDSMVQGDTVRLDASASYDPEGEPLRYRWYSDLESYPLSSLLGEGKVFNLSLNTTGVHRVWLEVSDGGDYQRSQDLVVRVMPRDGSESEVVVKEGIDLCDVLPYLLIGLALGTVLGIIVTLFILRRREQEPQPPPPVLVDAKVTSEYHVPHCPYCSGEVRPTDEYCVKCGTVFTAEDKERILTESMTGKRRKKRSRIELQRPDEESILPPSIEGEPIFLEAPAPDEEKAMEAGMMDLEEVDELEELEDIEELEELGDEDDEVWEVDQ